MAVQMDNANYGNQYFPGRPPRHNNFDPNYTRGGGNTSSFRGGHGPPSGRFGGSRGRGQRNERSHYGFNNRQRKRPSQDAYGPVPLSTLQNANRRKTQKHFRSKNPVFARCTFDSPPSVFDQACPYFRSLPDTIPAVCSSCSCELKQLPHGGPW